MKTAVIYYSLSGNTRRIARMAAEASGADIAEIEPASAYEGEYMEIVEQGKREVEEGFLPDVRPLPIDIGGYDCIIIGSPTWWYTIAPAVRSFVRSQNWQGKLVIPFTTNGGWPGEALDDLGKACRGASVKCGREIRFDSSGGNDLVTPQKDIDRWLKEIKTAIM